MWNGGRRGRWAGAPLAALAVAFVTSIAALAQIATTGPVGSQGIKAPQRTNLPPRVIQAQRFLAERGWPQKRAGLGRVGWRSHAPMSGAQAQTAATASSTWQALGPTAVVTPNYGLVTGRVSSMTLDPSDSTGNRLYLGTTGGGVWVAQNAATPNPANVIFTPLTDTVAALTGAQDASISIGALTVQAGGTGVILAGTGDPNDALDSYYGAGILRSADGGNTWSLIQSTADQRWSFAGEGFAGFAWSTVNPQLVVGAVSQAYEGTLVNAARPQTSYEGLYYSTDSGATWNLAMITDGGGADVQGPTDAFASPDGNAATSVVWNPVRQMFVAAVRFHGYYQSADGVTWTRMTAQPGAGLTTQRCPTNSAETGSIACPIFRGTLAVNPQTGDMFAWTVDINNQDQGMWQDQCAVSSGACANPNITFAQQWNTAALETSTVEGASTIANGDYTLALAAVPSQQDTLLLAGDGDLWKCSLAMGCTWRNTTNASTCMSAHVAPYQHVLAWNVANPLEIFAGNDSGLWRSLDAVGETDQVCAATDASHFQNLNGSLGSLAEVVSMSQATVTPYTMMAGLGVNGTAGVQSSTGPVVDWPQILGGDGGPVAIDPTNSEDWYVNNGAGVSIYLCADAALCTPAAFGTGPVVNNADVGGDGLAMTTPAPFLVDPLDAAQLLIGTCRVWRGPANGIGWSGGNAISPILDSGATSVGAGSGGTENASCNGDALIRSMAAMALVDGGEVVYVGMFGSANGGTQLSGHVLRATVNPGSDSAPVWQDLTRNPVTNDSNALNAYGLDISSIFVDTHDPTGQTVYMTVEGIPTQPEAVRVAYRSTDGGAHWASLVANLPWAPANALVVDPQDANTAYIATDAGVYFTPQVGNCANLPSNCWSAFGSGLPQAPVVGLSAAASAQVLVAATYGRGLWQTPLRTAGTGLTTANASPVSLTFGSQMFGTAGAAQTVTLTNTGLFPLTSTSIAMSGDFSETDDCVNVAVASGGNCTIQVTFTPAATGSRTGQMTISANVNGGQLTVDLSGTGTPSGAVSLTPANVDFGQVEVGTTSAPLQVEAGNSSGTAAPITGVTITSPFKIASNACGTSTLAADTDCQVMVEFAPSQAGAVTGTLTFIDGAGTQTVALSGTGATGPTDSLGTTLLGFAGTVVGELSTAQTVSLTNGGDLPLTSIAVSVSGAFQMSSNCGTQLSGHANCSISVVFAPSQSGRQTGTLTVSDSLRTQTVALSGTGVQPPAIGVSPPSLSFAGQQVGVASAPSTLTVSNTGGAPMANMGFQITGQAASSFTTGATTCGAELTNGNSCTVQVIFTPAAAGGSAATLVISSSTPGVTAVSVPLNGTVQIASVPGTIHATPAVIDFGAVGVGMASTPTTLTVTNPGTTAFSNLVLSVPAGFQLVNDTCATTLGPGSSCTAGVVFAPASAGAQSGSLTITSSTASTGATVSLSGMGFDFTLASSGAASQTVASGQTASYTLAITPIDGSQGSFTFQCGALPANALCLFNPGSEMVSAGASGNVTLQISTGQSGSSARSVVPIGWQVVPLVCGLVLLPLGWRRRRKALLLVALGAILAGGVSSCTSSGGGYSGSGSGVASSSGSTPAGTYAIPVTVISTGMQHGVTVTLTVD